MLTVFIEVLEQLLAGQLLTRFNNLCNPSIINLDPPSLAAFAHEMET